MKISREGVHSYHWSLKRGRELNGLRISVFFYASSNNLRCVYKEKNHVTPQGLKEDTLLFYLTERPRASKKSEKVYFENKYKGIE